jgi:uncharacterized repeat protein (TIGR01451 family)/fimbrial isopeptide formation D2 family protein
VRKARIVHRDIQSITKTAVWSSLADTATRTTLNPGEQIQFEIEIKLSEGDYTNFSVSDSIANILPALSSCTTTALTPIAAEGGTATDPNGACHISSNVTITGTTVSVAGTDTNSAPNNGIGVLKIRTKPVSITASGTNTATVLADNAPEQSSSVDYSVKTPTPSLSKTMTEASAADGGNGGGLDGGDWVLIKVTWVAGSNGPVYQCTITDDLTTMTPSSPFKPNTAQDLSTGHVDPAGYTCSFDINHKLTCSSNSATTACAGGAFSFKAQLLDTATIGSNYANTANLQSKTLPSGHPNDGDATYNQPINKSGTATIGLTAPKSTKTVTSTSVPDPDTVGSQVAIGERITYKITFVLPEGVTKSVTLIDRVLAGLSNLDYVPNSAALAISTPNPTPAPTCASGACTINSVTRNTTTNEIQIPLGDVNVAVGNGPATYTLTLDFIVKNTSANNIGTTLSDQGRLRFQNASGGFSNADTATRQVTVAEPVLDVAKAVSPGAPQADDTVTYKVTVSNTGTAPVYDAAVKDTLPSDLVAAFGFDPTLAVCVPSCGLGDISGGFTANVLKATIKQINPGQTVTLTYTAVVKPGTLFGKTVINTATVYGSSLPNGLAGDANGTPDERTGTGSSVNDLTRLGTGQFTTEQLKISKHVLNPKTYYAIGEDINYELQIAVPKGSAKNLSTVDTLPAGLEFVSSSATVTFPQDVSSATVSGGSITPSTNGNQLTFTLGDVYADKPGNILVQFKARVKNESTNQSGATFTNAATAAYDNPSGGNPIVESASGVPTVAVGEPNLTVTKAILGGIAPNIPPQAGDTIKFQIVVGNSGLNTAYQLVLNDTLPPALDSIAIESVTSTGGIFLNGTTTAVTTTDFTLLGANNSTLTSVPLQIAPGQTLTLVFTAKLTASAGAGNTVNNNANATYKSTPVDNPQTRDTSSPGPDDDDNSKLNNYAESGSVSFVVAEKLAIQKSISPASATIGQTATYTLRVDVIEGTTQKVVVNDTLPAGLTYVTSTVRQGNTGILFSNATYETPVITGQTLQFDLGDAENPSDGDRTNDYFEIDIVVRVDNVVDNQDGTGLSNGNGSTPQVSVTATIGGTDTTANFDADPPTPGYQGRTLTVTEPKLKVTKTALPTSQALGDVVTYLVTIEHDAGSSADAFDIQISDQIDSNLTYIPGSLNLQNGSVSGSGLITGTIGSLPLLVRTTSFSYQARINTNATANTSIPNTVSIKWASQSGADGTTTSGRNGGGGINDYTTSDSASVTPTASAVIDAGKTVAIVTDTAPTGVANSGDVLEYTVTLKNSGSSTVNNVVFTDPIPANTTYVSTSVTTSQGTLNTPATAVNVSVGSMLPGATVTITFRVTINANVANGVVISNQGTVDSDETVPTPTDADSNPTHGAQPTDVTVGQPVGGGGTLYAQKTANPVVVAAGGTVTYTITLKNTSSTANLTNVQFTDTVPSQITVTGVSANASFSGQVVTATGISLAPGASATITITGTASNTVTGTYNLQRWHNAQQHPDR